MLPAIPFREGKEGYCSIVSEPRALLQAEKYWIDFYVLNIIDSQIFRLERREKLRKRCRCRISFPVECCKVSNRGMVLVYLWCNYQLCKKTALVSGFSVPKLMSSSRTYRGVVINISIIISNIKLGITVQLVYTAWLFELSSFMLEYF